MPWTEDRYPPSMQHLPSWVRRKAIAIANALLSEGMDEGRAIRIAIARARQWAVQQLGAVSPNC
ncbi:MAG TPA: hypothetical protein VJ743_05115 [Albitalea sp.]|nr:hypothetical protein [Albitalea sp.]